MRCPYCGGLNSDQAQFCARCGRDMSKPPVPTAAPRARPSYPTPSQTQQPPYPRPPVQGYPRPIPPDPAQVPGVVTPPSQPPRQVPSAASTRRRPAEAQVNPFSIPPIPDAPDAPAPFPSRTIEQLKTLEQGALNYTVVNEEENVGRKKTVRILYQRCTPWQQAATLLKALKEQQADKFTTMIIQGLYAQESGAYGFTNGQLQFDRGVRLGSQIMNRYQIETGNGFDANSIRIVLSE